MLVWAFQLSGKLWFNTSEISDMVLTTSSTTVSTNRAFAYGCLYEFIAFSRYHAGHVPFFHYFTHLYHPACRPFRGKANLIADITMMESKERGETAEEMDET